MTIIMRHRENTILKFIAEQRDIKLACLYYIYYFSVNWILILNSDNSNKTVHYAHIYSLLSMIS